jgi:hypothetical protein
MSKLIALHLDAGHTANGNPRRLYLIIDTQSGNVVDAIDEGHRGHGAIPKDIKVVFLYGTDRLATTPKEYRDLLRDAETRNKAHARVATNPKARYGDNKRKSRRSR